MRHVSLRWAVGVGVCALGLLVWSALRHGSSARFRESIATRCAAGDLAAVGHEVVKRRAEWASDLSTVELIARCAVGSRPRYDDYMQILAVATVGGRELSAAAEWGLRSAEIDVSERVIGHAACVLLVCESPSASVKEAVIARLVEAARKLPIEGSVRLSAQQLMRVVARFDWSRDLVTAMGGARSPGYMALQVLLG